MNAWFGSSWRTSGANCHPPNSVYGTGPANRFPENYVPEIIGNSMTPNTRLVSSLDVIQCSCLPFPSRLRSKRHSPAKTFAELPPLAVWRVKTFRWTHVLRLNTSAPGREAAPSAPGAGELHGAGQRVARGPAQFGESRDPALGGTAAAASGTAQALNGGCQMGQTQFLGMSGSQCRCGELVPTPLGGSWQIHQCTWPAGGFGAVTVPTMRVKRPQVLLDGGLLHSMPGCGHRHLSEDP